MTEILIAIYLFLTELVDTIFFDLFARVFAYLIEILVIMYFKVANAVMPFAWAIASNIMEDLNISAYMLNAWTAIPLESRQILAFFRIPEFINIITSFAVMKVVLKFIPFSN